MKIYSDGSTIEEINELISQYNVNGFTTNPSLMKKIGVKNYTKYCQDFIKMSNNLPVSFEVFADDLSEMERQAEIISSWGTNVFVKIPITNTKGESTCKLITKLQDKAIKINVTAIFTKEQIDSLSILNPKVNSIVSIFAGRIADTGRNPKTNVSYAVEKFKSQSKIEVLWASTREIYNVYQARELGCDIITMQNSLLKKLKLSGKNLEEFSLDTVKMFRIDALNCDFKL